MAIGASRKAAAIHDTIQAAVARKSHLRAHGSHTSGRMEVTAQGVKRSYFTARVRHLLTREEGALQAKGSHTSRHVQVTLKTRGSRVSAWMSHQRVELAHERVERTCQGAEKSHKVRASYALRPKEVTPHSARKPRQACGSTLKEATSQGAWKGQLKDCILHVA
jgi:hypothetical protein